MDTVFFDASVLFKAAVTRFVLGAALSGEYRPAWSEAVIDEARRNLLAAGRLSALAALEQNLVLIRDPIVQSADSEAEATLVRTDAKDRHVMAAASKSGATLLLTDNTKDFDPDEARSLGLVVVSPDQFATSIARRSPYALLRHVQRVPRSRLDRYAEILTRELPTTMSIVAPFLLS